MNKNTKRATELLDNSNFTCVLCKDELTYQSEERGIKPLIALIESEKDCNGFSGADLIIGKAAAMLYIILGVHEAYGKVMSKTGRDTLLSFGIEPFYDELTDKIINRKGDGLCPMETAVNDINNPNDAYFAIKNKISELSKAN